MKDPVFSGRDVSEAVRQASRTLAVPEAALRYVVLDPGQPGGRGLAATEARIAVLMQRAVTEEEQAQGRARRERRREPRPEAVAEALEMHEPAEAARALLAEFARSAGCQIDCDVRDVRDGLEVDITGPGASMFFDPQGETLAALEHVIERLCEPGARVRVQCQGYREYRDECLRAEALALAGQVSTDGRERTTTPLNSYERRVIHVTLDGHPDVRTFSVGEGRSRRVTVARREQADEGPPAAGGGAVEDAVPPSETAAADEEPDARGAEVPPAERAAAERPETARASEKPSEFDARRYDRPPEGGSAPELM